MLSVILSFVMSTECCYNECPYGECRGTIKSSQTCLLMGFLTLQTSANAAKPFLLEIKLFCNKLECFVTVTNHTSLKTC